MGFSSRFKIKDKNGQAFYVTRRELVSRLLGSSSTPTLGRPVPRMATAQRFGFLVKRSPGSSRLGAKREGRPSVPIKNTQDERLEAGYFVQDSINHRRHEGQPEKPGVILVLRGCRPLDPDALIGRSVLIKSTLGVMMISPVGAVRDHGATISILVEGLSRDVVPIGSDVGFIPESSQGVSIPHDEFKAMWRYRAIYASLDQSLKQTIPG